MNIEWLKNKEEEKFYPVGHEEAILCGENSDITLKDKLDTIQSTSFGYIKDIGWYRIAEITGSVRYLPSVLSLKIIVAYDYTYPEYHDLNFLFKHTDIVISSNVDYTGNNNVNIISKLRYVYDGNSNKTYIDVYWERQTTMKNLCYFVATTAYTNKYWKILNPISVEEELEEGSNIVKTFDIQANDTINDRLSNIQSINTSYLSQSGWYRIAEYKSGENSRRGAGANSCKVTLKRAFNSKHAESIELTLLSIYDKQEFILNNSHSVEASHILTKIRYSYDNESAYIEVYYSADVENPLLVSINSTIDNYNIWKAITPTLTEESVEGVTVTTTYDIPANAKPVTDLDIVRFAGTETLNTSILEKAVELPNGIYNYRLGGSEYTSEDLPRQHYAYSIARIEKRSYNDLTVTLSGTGDSNIDLAPIFNHYTSNGWVGWKTLATTDDLSNRTHKIYSGNSETEIDTMYENFHNNALNSYYYEARTYHSVIHPILSGGVFILTGFRNTADYGWQRITSYSNKAGLIQFERSIYDGVWTPWVKTFTNAGGKCKRTIFETTGSSSLSISRTDAEYPLISFDCADKNLGYIGFNGTNNPIYRTTDGFIYPILHTGNYTDYAVPKVTSEKLTLYVDNVNGSDDNDGLTTTSPIKTITRDMAVNMGGYSGIVFIFMSDYTGDITLPIKNALTLQSTDSSNPVTITGTVKSSAIPYLWITNININYAGNYTLQIGNTNCYLKNVSVTNTNGIGITSQRSMMYINNSTITASSYGIVSTYTSHITFADNCIINAGSGAIANNFGSLCTVPQSVIDNSTYSGNFFVNIPTRQAGISLIEDIIQNTTANSNQLGGQTAEAWQKKIDDLKKYTDNLVNGLINGES